MFCFYVYIENSLGKILLISDGAVLTGLYFDGQKNIPHIDASWIKNPNLDVFLKTGDQLDEYAQGKRTIFDIPYSIAFGTSFGQKVWRAIMTVPYGKTCSYSDIAKEIGAPRSVRAVASSVGKNPISILIPCHRIIGSNGGLVGYAGGLEKKRELLFLEKVF